MKYNEAIKAVSNGAMFEADFKERKLKINGVATETTKGNEEVAFGDLDDWLDKAEELYGLYKYSVPTRTNRREEVSKKFKALSKDELASELGISALSSPETRSVARAKLELFILYSLVDGTFNPDELFRLDWFYQGADKSFIIRSDWF